MSNSIIHGIIIPFPHEYNNYKEKLFRNNSKVLVRQFEPRNSCVT